MYLKAKDTYNSGSLHSKLGYFIIQVCICVCIVPLCVQVPACVCMYVCMNAFIFLLSHFFRMKVPQPLKYNNLN